MFFMSAAHQPKNVHVVEAEASQVASIYAPPYIQAVKKKKVFFILGNDPEQNEK